MEDRWIGSSWTTGGVVVRGRQVDWWFVEDRWIGSSWKIGGLVVRGRQVEW